ncbi:hypothetical protein [Nocardia farcinica]|uniref:hypothetical protein n=2 Tax=Nocardia farcinica TaxID=37329 RepID=UPI0015F0F932|nr:hypothetical protein [Nocardia farcinica]MBA4858760.1 hypothetical protein [Nocardia farcinica]MBC9816073.1 hypothetical protein [Nocardia farcinica]MBF6068349.1 hypothetical protein [Nocardia farcinica]
MRSSDPENEPFVWRSAHRGARKRAASIAALIGLVVLCFGIATAMWSSGDSSARAVSKYVAIFGIAMFATVMMGVWISVGRWRRGVVTIDMTKDTPATVVPGSVCFFGLYQLIWVCFALLFLGAAFEIAGAGTAWPLAVLLACLGVGSASAPILALAGRLRPGRLVLTPDEIIHDGWSSRSRISWNEVLRVSAAVEQLPLIIITGVSGARWNHQSTTPVLPVGRRPQPIWSLDRAVRSGHLGLEPQRFGVNGSQLYRFLVHYADHPDCRTELGKPASLDRWRELA